MRIAFYAPMKPPDHPRPSGDRRMANLLMQALRLAGQEVELASRFCSRDGAGDPDRQARLAQLGAGLADRILRRFRARPADQRPGCWFTYHLYYKAPDWLGPTVCRGLDIPYFVAEASVAPKRAGGPWDLGHRATVAALERASAVITLNPDDAACLPETCPVRPIPPFLDPAPGRAAARARDTHRAALCQKFALNPDRPIIATVAMMRPGDKLASYRLLADALARLPDSAWQLLVVGDGPARGDVERAFAALAAGDDGGRRVQFAGAVGEPELPALLAGCDLLAWPAINEAYGMSLLEAQATGLPVVAGRSGGVPALVESGATGLLSDPGDATAFAADLERLLNDPERRARLGRAALAKVAREHSLEQAAVSLKRILETPGAS
jgi:glycosyltransferase involved in cell wall biosynthesis